MSENGRERIFSNDEENGWNPQIGGMEKTSLSYVANDVHDLRDVMSWLLRQWRIVLSVLSLLMIWSALKLFYKKAPDIPEMVLVEAGSFIMGSSDNANDWWDRRHRVTLTKDFWIGKYEVTQRQYIAIMGTNPSEEKKGGDYPVINVSGIDALEYCKKLTEHERKAGRLPDGYEYTLPTEAQWEFAARGGNLSKGYRFSGGNRPDDVAWYEGNQEYSVWHNWRWNKVQNKLEHDKSTIRLVGRKQPNELGIYDMSGNVFEWCREKNKCYPNEAVVDPSDDDDIANWKKDGPSLIIRGGAYFVRRERCLLTARSSENCHSTYYGFVGFRVALVSAR